jgi:hypothetical protein
MRAWESCVSHFVLFFFFLRVSAILRSVLSSSLKNRALWKLYLVVIAGLARPATLNYEKKKIKVQSFDADIRVYIFYICVR